VSFKLFNREEHWEIEIDVVRKVKPSFDMIWCKTAVVCLYLKTKKQITTLNPRDLAAGE